MRIAKLNAYWVTCTPEWVSTYDACAEVVRRPILEPCDMGDDKEGHFHTIGHQHLMAMPGLSPWCVPVDLQPGASAHDA